MELKALKALTAAALLAATTAATAGTAPFSMVSGATAPGVDVSLTIQESVTPGYDYDFVVSNSSLMGIVTGVYFEVDWNSMLSGLGMSTGPATLIADNVNPNIDGWAGSTASHTTEVERIRTRQGRGYVDNYYDNLDHGIQEGQTQVFSFASSGALSLEDLESMLATEGYGVAIRMQGLTEDEQAAGWGLAEDRPDELLVVQAISTRQTDGDDKVEVVSAPSPTAALAGLVVAGIAGLRRRRRD